MSDKSPVLVVPAISDPNWEGIRAVGKYEHREMICSPRDRRVTFVFSYPPNQRFLQFRRENLGYTNGETYIVTTGQGRHLGEKLLNDENTLNYLRMKFPRGTLMRTFTVGPTEEELAETLGFRILGTASHTKLGSKSQLRLFAKALGISVPQGYECLQGVKAVIAAAKKLFNNGVEKIVVKGDYGASSSQNKIFSNEPGWKAEIRTFCYQIKFKTGVVEEWREDVFSSPSIHFICNGRVIPLIGPWDQVFRGDNRIFAGAKSPAMLSREAEAMVKAQGYALAMAFFKEGYMGPIGFDSIVLIDGNVMWSDVNARDGGVTYIRKFAEEQGLQDKVVWGLDLVDGRLKGMTFEYILKRCDRLLYHYLRKDQGGVVFYNVDCMSEGKIQIIIVADTPEDAQYILLLVAKQLFNQYSLPKN